MTQNIPQKLTRMQYVQVQFSYEPHTNRWSVCVFLFSWNETKRNHRITHANRNETHNDVKIKEVDNIQKTKKKKSESKRRHSDDRTDAIVTNSYISRSHALVARKTWEWICARLRRKNETAAFNKTVNEDEFIHLGSHHSISVRDYVFMFCVCASAGKKQKSNIVYYYLSASYNYICKFYVRERNIIRTFVSFARKRNGTTDNDGERMRRN